MRRHDVDFPKAATVLTDDYALTREEADSIGEQRFVSLGMRATGARLDIVFTYSEPDIYRLISAWKANKPQHTRDQVSLMTYASSVLRPYKIDTQSMLRPSAITENKFAVRRGSRVLSVPQN